MKKKNEPKPIKVKGLDGKEILVGKYDEQSRHFSCEQCKSIDFYSKLNAWGIDEKVVDFLLKYNADITIKDKESKWEFKCNVGDLKLYGTVESFKTRRSKIYLPLDKWEVVRTSKDRSYVLKCDEVNCMNNFGHNCLRGVISIDSSGECANYEDKY